LIAIAVSILYKPKNGDLRNTGIEVEGIIYEEGSEVTFKNPSTFGRMTFVEKTVLRFLTKENKWITGQCNGGIFYFNFRKFKAGEHVKVFYDKDEPSNFLIATNQS